MDNSYLNLVTKSSFIKESVEDTSEHGSNLKDAIVTYAANLDSSVNIYEALRKFIESYTENIDRRAELLDTLEFCEADEADLEATLIKLKIAMDNPVITENSVEEPERKIVRKNIHKQEGLKMIDKDFLIKESDVTKAIKNSRNETPRKELDPVRCFVVLDKNDNPMLNKGGIVITNVTDAEQQIQQRADDLYRLIHNAKSVYMIEDEAYDKSVDIRDKKEYVKFVKANGQLIKRSEAGEPFATHDLDDDDFLVNIDEMFE